MNENSMQTLWLFLDNQLSTLQVTLKLSLFALGPKPFLHCTEK